MNLYKENKKQVLKFLETFNKIFKNKEVPLHEPDVGDKEIKLVKQALKLNQISTYGNYAGLFEKKLKKYTKSKYAVVVNSGTSALHLSMIAVGIKKDDEVLLPVLNFIASANACLYIGAVPHFIDINEDNLGVDCLKLDEYLKKVTIIKNKNCYNKNTGRKIKAIIPMHTFGFPVNMKKLISISKKYKLKIIEDAAEGLGSYYKKKHVGTIANIGVLSFNGNKIISSGAGGAIITQSKVLANTVRHLSVVSKKKHPWNFDFDGLGYNYKMPSINAALGCAQLDRINYFLKKKSRLFKFYKNKFRNQKIFKFIDASIDSRPNFWLVTLVLNKSYSKFKNLILSNSNKKKIKIRPAWKLLSQIKYLKRFPSMPLKTAIKLNDRIINLPSSSNLIDKIN